MLTKGFKIDCGAWQGRGLEMPFKLDPQAMKNVDRMLQGMQ